MLQENITIRKKYGNVILPSKIYEKLINEGKYIVCTQIKRSYGIYKQVMVCKKEKSKLVYRKSLARVILNDPKGKHVDHIDRNPLNNSINNLRTATVSENGCNRTKSVNTKFEYMGIAQKNFRFYASLAIKGKRFTVTNLDNKEEAAHAYNLLSKILHGDFGTQNKVPTKKPKWINQLEKTIKKHS